MFELLAIEAGGFAQAVSLAFENLFSLDWYSNNFWPLMQIIMIDVVLAGDNAIVVGLAASRVAPEIRSKVIFWGILGAVILRILFASVTNQLLATVGLTLAGGILLLWVCWKMYREITDGSAEQLEEAEKGLSSAAKVAAPVSFATAVWQIIIADVSMSLDNVLAVAGAAKGETLVLVVGLTIAIILMAIAAHAIARLLVRYPWITWIGLLIILYVALDMIFRGSHEVICSAYATDFEACKEGGLWDLFKLITR